MERQSLEMSTPSPPSPLVATAVLSDVEATALSDVEVAEPEIVLFPPMPTPAHRELWGEMMSGVKVILGAIGLVLGITHGVLLNPSTSNLSETLRYVCMGVVYAEAVAALACLERILNGDPGTIKRTPETQHPVPEAVKEKLQSGAPLDGLRNIQSDDGSSFCTRCCVWRPSMRKAHHCSLCQRCVVDFDHHCGFYGRCIAGTRTSGNMPFFIALITLGYAAFFTILVFVVLAATAPGR